MNKDILLRFHFPIIEKKINFKVQELKAMDFYHATFIVGLYELSNEKEQYFTLKQIFKDIFNIRNDLLIRLFWLKIVRDLIGLNVISLNGSYKDLEDKDLLEYEVKKIKIHPKIESYISHNKFYLLDSNPTEKNNVFYLRPKFLSEEYTEYFNEQNIDKKTYIDWYDNTDINEELEQKIAKAEEDIERSKNRIVVDIKRDKTPGLLIAFFESIYSTGLEYKEEKIDIKISTKTKNQLVFIEELKKPQIYKMQENSATLLINKIFPNNEQFSDLKVVDNNPFDLNKFDNEYLFKWTNKVEFEPFLDYIIYKKKLFNLYKFNCNLYIEEHKFNKEYNQLIIPFEINEDEYLSIVKQIYNKSDLYDQAFLEKVDLSEQIKLFLKKEIQSIESLDTLIDVKELIKVPYKDWVKQIKALYNNEDVFINIFNQINDIKDYSVFVNQILTKDRKELRDEIVKRSNNMSIFNFYDAENKDLIIEIFAYNFDSWIGQYNNHPVFKTEFWTKTNKMINEKFEKHKASIEARIQEKKANNLNQNIYSELLSFFDSIKEITIVSNIKAYIHIEYINKFLEQSNEQLNENIGFIKEANLTLAMKLRNQLEDLAKEFANKTDDQKVNNWSKTLRKKDKQLADYYSYLSNNFAHNLHKNKNKDDKEHIKDNEELKAIDRYINNFKNKGNK
ncbi:hypothetical protein JM47_02985 [Ureaplasma diversum]|uniref:Uncharacterized protein n=1 Tax=Ureaplasma diversum TaxID=42094 RepID=A0A0C5RQ41_9BACT|nr:hypothetical protein [Ureaplasma diversum]AJQ45509.1 hypothetical protein JM47_02985 [Ureaplasma diversum]